MSINKKKESNVMRVKFIQPKIKFEYSAPEAKEVSLVGISINGILRQIR